MQANIRLVFLVIGILLFALNAISQTISYSYDDAGNRIRREIVLASRNVNPNKKNKLFSEMLCEKKITIHPNPTKGSLKIVVGGLSNDDTCDIKLYSTSGSQLYSIKPSSQITNLDISAHPNGMYILSIIINDSATTWKIIKE